MCAIVPCILARWAQPTWHAHVDPSPRLGGGGLGDGGKGERHWEEEACERHEEATATA